MAKKPGDLTGGYIHPDPQVRISVQVTESERDDLQKLARREDGGVSGFVHALITKKLYSKRFYWGAHIAYAVPLAFLVGLYVGIKLDLAPETAEDLIGNLLSGALSLVVLGFIVLLVVLWLVVGSLKIITNRWDSHKAHRRS